MALRKAEIHVTASAFAHWVVVTLFIAGRPRDFQIRSGLIGGGKTANRGALSIPSSDTTTRGCASSPGSPSTRLIPSISGVSLGMTTGGNAVEIFQNGAFFDSALYLFNEVL